VGPGNQKGWKLNPSSGASLLLVREGGKAPERRTWKKGKLRRLEGTENKWLGVSKSKRKTPKQKQIPTGRFEYP